MKNYRCGLALWSEPQIWKLHVVLWQTSYVIDCTKKRAARAARLLFLIQPIKSWLCGAVVVVLPSSFLQLPSVCLTPLHPSTPTPYCDGSVSSFKGSVSMYFVPIRTTETTKWPQNGADPWNNWFWKSACLNYKSTKSKFHLEEITGTVLYIERDIDHSVGCE